MSLRPRLKPVIEIDGIRFVLAGVASLVLRNSPPTEITGGNSGKSAGRALELKFQCKLAKPPLIVVAARS